MSVPAAFIGVIVIWSTTPLAIKWSGEGPGFLFGVSARMLIGTVLCLALMKLVRVALPWDRAARRTYVAAGAAIYASMLCVYWAAQQIPSGLISVLFGLTPLMTGVFASLWLAESSLTPPKLLGMLAGLAGLVFVFGGGLTLGVASVQGIAAVLVSVVLHALSAVWVKRIDAQLPAMAVTGGGLLFALPFYLLTWLLFDGVLPAALPVKALWSIVYLGVFGSVLGFILYYHVLKHLEAGRTALITLVTPVLALLLGNTLNGETVGVPVAVGTALILSGLVLYQWGGAAYALARRRLMRSPV